MKSEIKALKKKKKKGAEEELFEDEEEAPKKKHKDGELIDDLEEDDLAFGSGDSDDGLSVMSDLSDMSDMSDMSNMSDLDSDLGDDMDDSELFSDEEELEWEDENGTEDAPHVSAFPDEPLDNVASDDESEDDSEDDSEDSEDDSEDEEDSDLEATKKRTARPQNSDDDDVETRYEQRPAGPRPMKPRPTKLPTISNGNIVRAASPLDRSPSPSPEPSPEPERIPKTVEYRSDPLGQRFGRPAVRQLLEIKDKKERVGRAREEIADLGREASGTGEGEGGVRLPILRLRYFLTSSFHSSICSSDCCHSLDRSSRRRPPLEVVESDLFSSIARFELWRWSVCWPYSSTLFRKLLCSILCDCSDTSLQWISYSTVDGGGEASQSQSVGWTTERMGGWTRQRLQALPGDVRD